MIRQATELEPADPDAEAKPEWSERQFIYGPTPWEIRERAIHERKMRWIWRGVAVGFFVGMAVIRWICVHDWSQP